MNAETKTTVQKELGNLCQANGGLLMPGKVVQAAQHEDSPLHEHFEWDDAKAAHEYRVSQAVRLIEGA